MVKNVILDLNYKDGTSKSKSNMKFYYKENTLHLDFLSYKKTGSHCFQNVCVYTKGIFNVAIIIAQKTTSNFYCLWTHLLHAYEKIYMYEHIIQINQLNIEYNNYPSKTKCFDLDNN